MNERKLTTEYLGKEYDHGTATVEQKNGIEWNVKADVEGVISSEDYDCFCKDIQEVIRKYFI